MGTQRASRLRREVKAVAKVVAFAMVLCGVVAASPWRPSARRPDPPRRRPALSPGPVHRQLVSTALFDDLPTQPAPSPASASIMLQGALADGTEQLAHGAQLSPQPSVSRPRDGTAAAGHASALSQPDVVAHLQQAVPAAVPLAEPSVRSSSLRSADRGMPEIAQPSSVPAPDAAEDAARIELALAAAAIASQPARPWDRWEGRCWKS